MIGWLRGAPRAPQAPVVKTLRIGERELPLVIRRLRQARQMTLRLAPDGSEVRVSIPPWGRIGDAESFARDRAAWLARQVAELPAAVTLEPGSQVAYRGAPHTVAWAASAPRKPAVLDGAVVLGGPREGVENRLRKWLEGEALRLCAEDLAHYCDRAGEPVPALGLSRARRRWGSCAANGSIRINWRLVMAPDFVRRSVVAHEVAHLRHFDHSPAFHTALAQIYEGEIEQANRWLKAHGRSLYLLF